MANTYDFSDRVALVTGGASGIGAASAARLREGGAQVAIFDRAAVDGYPSVTGDIASSADVNAGVAEVERELGPIDVLVNSAGVPGESIRTTEVTDEEWQRVLAINANGSFYMCRAVLPGMMARGYGRIVLVASIAGKEGNPMAAAYSASKAAVIAMTKSIGKDVAGSGVLVNCIAPAVIETPILDGLSQHHIDYMIERIPLGRMGRAEEVATLACFLASEDLSFSTGAAFDISGGRAVY
jgi:NAD(P)-dependent dehydrogenase (short-subunit alcohol dehydrogenase family)